ncbi:hypothetical protein [Cryptosporangium arvum]|uniref:hypothetical protein n=1 Tax=Cryptosporangium arvum TaxID=80871 RepID=UPI0004AF2D48|nr:hypothetical protein [Cryptosporangium arvum]
MSRPEWNGSAADVAWSGYFADRALHGRVLAVVTGLPVVLAARYVVPLVRRARRLPAPDRPGVWPVLPATGLAAGSAVLALLDADVWTSWRGGRHRRPRPGSAGTPEHRRRGRNPAERPPSLPLDPPRDAAAW